MATRPAIRLSAFHMRFRLVVMASAAAITFAAIPAQAQDVVIDWSKKKVVASPAEVQKGNPLKVQVTQLNDLLYEYSITVQVTTDSSDDFSLLAGLLPTVSGGKAPAGGDPCPAALRDALAQTTAIKDALNGPAFNPDDGHGHYTSIPLSSTLTEWNGPISKAFKKLQADVTVLSSCADNDSKNFVNNTYPPIKSSMDSIQKKVDGSHTATGQAPASTGEVVSATVTVNEKWKGAETVKAPALTPAPYVTTLKFESILRLSAGVLFSQLQDRSYVSSTVPSTSGSGTMNILGVNGNFTLTPYLTGLLNYRLPIPEFGKSFDVWLSSGPTLRVTNSGSNSSAFGFFGGGSISLWKRLFITPGIHFGQFAGVPAGLTVGQTIPANFGQLQPINRWSARFALSITFKTLSLGGLTKSSQNPASPKPNPKPAKNPNPGQKPNPNALPTPAPTPTSDR